MQGNFSLTEGLGNYAHACLLRGLIRAPPRRDGLGARHTTAAPVRELILRLVESARYSAGVIRALR